MAAPTPGRIALHCREDGEGPAVVLLHGMGGDHTLWNGQIPDLASEFHTLAPDLRGHGRSPLPDGSTCDFPEMLGDLEGLLADRAINRVHLVGLSGGAFLALQYAMLHPDRVGSLVLVGGATHCDAHTRAVGRSWIETYQHEGKEAFSLRLMKDLFAAEWLEAHLDRVDEWRRRLEERDFRGATLWGRAIERFDLRGRLGKLTAPTLALHGLDDHVVDISHARLIRQTLPRAQFRLFPLTGHMVPVERPQECSASIRDWLVAPPGESKGRDAAQDDSAAPL